MSRESLVEAELLRRGDIEKEGCFGLLRVWGLGFRECLST